MNIDEMLKELGLTLPKATDPVGSYVATKISGNFLYISGQISIDADGKLTYNGDWPNQSVHIYMSDWETNHPY